MLTDDEKRELIAEAREHRENRILCARCSAMWPCLPRRLADALEATLTEPEWEYVILNGLGYEIYMAYSLESARLEIARDQAGPGTIPKRSLKRRRAAGPWEVVPNV